MGSCCSDRGGLPKEETKAIDKGKGIQKIVLHMKKGPVPTDSRLSFILPLLFKLKGKEMSIKADTELPGEVQLQEVLEYNGKFLTGEPAIGQYVSRIEKMYPVTDPVQIYFLESLISEVIDLWQIVKDKDYANDQVQIILGKVENRLPSNGRYFIANTLSLADLYLYDFLTRANLAKVNVPKRLQEFVQEFQKEHGIPGPVIVITTPK